jgi:hypothetical protein
MNQLNLLSDEQKQEYMELIRVFREPGWKQIVTFCEGQRDVAYNAGANATSWDDNRVAYGRRVAYEELASFETITENYFNSAAEAALEEQQLEEEEIYE